MCMSEKHLLRSYVEDGLSGPLQSFRQPELPYVEPYGKEVNVKKKTLDQGSSFADKWF